MTDFTIGSEARCSDGDCGTVSRVIVDPVAKTVTHLVVTPRFGYGRLVPLDLVRRPHRQGPGPRRRPGQPPGDPRPAPGGAPVGSEGGRDPDRLRHEHRRRDPARHQQAGGPGPAAGRARLARVDAGKGSPGGTLHVRLHAPAGQGRRQPAPRQRAAPDAHGEARPPDAHVLAALLRRRIRPWLVARREARVRA
jgi:hypothetical protein